MKTADQVAQAYDLLTIALSRRVQTVLDPFGDPESRKAAEITRDALAWILDLPDAYALAQNLFQIDSGLRAKGLVMHDGSPDQDGGESKPFPDPNGFLKN